MCGLLSTRADAAGTAKADEPDSLPRRFEVVVAKPTAVNGPGRSVDGRAPQRQARSGPAASPAPRPTPSNFDDPGRSSSSLPTRGVGCRSDGHVAAMVRPPASSLYPTRLESQTVSLKILARRADISRAVPVGQNAAISGGFCDREKRHAGGTASEEAVAHRPQEAGFP